MATVEVWMYDKRGGDVDVVHLFSIPCKSKSKAWRMAYAIRAGLRTQKNRSIKIGVDTITSR